MIKFELLAAIGVAVMASSAQAACVKPTSEALIGEQVAATPVMVKPFTYQKQQLQWAAAGWEAPEGGQLFVLDCAGRKLATLEDFHEAKTLAAGPRIGGFPTLLASYVSVWGSNINGRGVGLYRFDGSSISMMWSHSQWDRGGNPPRFPFEEQRYSWRFSDGVTRIEVRGTEKIGSAPRHPLPVEHYCLRRSVLKYVACR